MRSVVRTSALALVVAVLVAFHLPSLDAATPGLGVPLHHLAHGFRNEDPKYDYPLMPRALRFLRHGFNAGAVRGTAPATVANNGAALRANGHDPTITWIGHATFLVQLDSENILTDPNWSDRASPVGFMGPRRLVPPGLRFEDLPPIQAVVISHDHYDHLDLPTVLRLEHAFHPRFFVPLGVGALLRGAGVRDVVELDWWDAARLGHVVFTATPAQHSSGRVFTDHNRRLWSSWVIAGRHRRLFFAGDTGYYAGFTAIGRRLGPFDAAALPIGGYSGFDKHHPNHLNPEEAVQAFEDLGARLLVPMHWGTFELNREPFREPPERLFKEALRRGREEEIAVLTQGETIPW